MINNDCRCPGCGQCDASSDYASLEADAARVVLAYIHGDTTELDEAIDALKSNGRHGWWEKYRPIGLRGESDDDAERTD